MKIINSPVRNISPEILAVNDPFIRGMARKAKAIAEAKKIARRRERALLRPLAEKELLQAHLEDVAEKREADRHAREYAYSNLMRKVQRSSRRHAKRARPSNRHQPVEFTGGENRLEFHVECMVDGEKRVSALLASCALYE